MPGLPAVAVVLYRFMTAYKTYFDDGKGSSFFRFFAEEIIRGVGEMSLGLAALGSSEVSGLFVWRYGARVGETDEPVSKEAMGALAFMRACAIEMFLSLAFSHEVPFLLDLITVLVN